MDDCLADTADDLFDLGVANVLALLLKMRNLRVDVSKRQLLCSCQSYSNSVWTTDEAYAFAGALNPKDVSASLKARRNWRIAIAAVHSTSGNRAGCSSRTMQCLHKVNGPA